MTKLWVYWPEQCKYCQNRKGCKYTQQVQGYISALQDIDDSGIYGTLSWWCDYFIVDSEKYFLDNPGECQA